MRQLGHRVHIADRYDRGATDLMVALHAWRSAESIRVFRELYPDCPLIVGLSGTDIYDYIDRDPEPTLRSLAYADRLVALQELARDRVPALFRDKVRVVHQSAAPVRRARVRRPESCDVAVIGHLRQVKDPFRAMSGAATGRAPMCGACSAARARWFCHR